MRAFVWQWDLGIREESRMDLIPCGEGGWRLTENLSERLSMAMRSMRIILTKKLRIY